MAPSPTRTSGNANSNPVSDTGSSPQTGSKRKAVGATSPNGKPSKKSQKTLEETMPGMTERKDEVEMKENGREEEVEMKENGQEEEVEMDESGQQGEEDATGATGANSGPGGIFNTGDAPDEKPHSSAEKPAAQETINGGATEHSPEREKKAPSNIVEKGIIYFITRARVGIEEPESVQELQRSYFILSPIAKGAKITEGEMEDTPTNRVFAIPKKVLPTNGAKLMAFVERTNVTMKTLKEDMFKGTTYDTQTMGTRHNSSITPVGQGVYAITQTERTSHLAYMLTIPEKPEEVQKEMGLSDKGSFVLSLKNPTKKGPAYATLDEKPDYPQEIIDDFGNYAWMPVTKSTYLDYANAQILLVGEHKDKFGSAVEPAEKDKNTDKETPQEELEMLEDEDQIRVEHLHGDDSIFDDLHISKKECSSIKKHW